MTAESNCPVPMIHNHASTVPARLDDPNDTEGMACPDAEAAQAAQRQVCAGMRSHTQSYAVLSLLDPEHLKVIYVPTSEVGTREPVQ